MVGEMRKEIHRMELRLGELMRLQVWGYDMFKLMGGILEWMVADAAAGGAQVIGA